VDAEDDRGIQCLARKKGIEAPPAAVSAEHAMYGLLSRATFLEPARACRLC
jgi:hypothetical protein